MNPPVQPTRREWLRAGAAAAAAPLLARAAGPAPRPGVIAEENRRPGTTDWQLTYVRTRQHRSSTLEGYCSATSVRAGGEIDLFLSTEPAGEVTVDVYRLGYYGGKGGRHVARLGPFPVTPQPTPPTGEHRLRECRWARTTRLPVPRDWVSGVYLGKLSCRAHRDQSYVIFVVRDDRPADLLFQTSDTTWQAYNKWPEAHSLYDTDEPKRPWNATTWVSYDRPYGLYPQVVNQPLSQGSGEFLLWEYPLCFWLEQHGYDVTYISNIDTHADGPGLRRGKCFLSVGHDEYWSLAMYEHVRAAIAEGMSAAFLCGNSVSAVVPLDLRNHAGQPHRLLYRRGMFGGASARNQGERWEEHGPDEALLLGGRTMFPANGSGDWIVTRAGHWLLDGTGLRDGDRIPGLVGWEHHGDPPPLPGLEVIAAGPTFKADGAESAYATTIHPGPRGNWVFNAATIFWSLGLAQPPGFAPPHAHLGRPHGPDERVQRITANFLRRCRILPSA
ncbi:MAG: N,N-dimethylformamidase beta subunit family domain-containing protein [Verrucomicrobiota bacterium]